MSLKYRDSANVFALKGKQAAIAVRSKVENTGDELTGDYYGAFTINSGIPLTTLSTIDADTLEGYNAAYFLNASNINAGTINDARLPGTITSNITGNAATANYASSANYAATASQAINSDKLGDESGSFYQNADNLTTGTIDNSRLNSTIDSDTTGNSDTTSALATAITITVTDGLKTGSATFDGSGDITITLA